MSLKTKELIAKHGLAVMGIFASPEGPSFTYTIGLTETYDHPEIIVFGIDTRIASIVLNHIAEEIKGGRKFTEGDVTDDFANYPVAFKSITTGQAAGYVHQSTFHYEGAPKQPTYLQLVLTDVAGKFPWDQGYAESMKRSQTELWNIAQN